MAHRATPHRDYLGGTHTDRWLRVVDTAEASPRDIFAPGHEDAVA